MPYCGGDLAMVLLLPDQADGIGAVEARLSPEVLETWLDALVHTRVAVSLPKFQLEVAHGEPAPCSRRRARPHRMRERTTRSM
jgi:serine protease inhibitor